MLSPQGLQLSPETQPPQETPETQLPQETPKTQSSLSPQQEALLKLREANEILSISSHPAEMWMFTMLFAVYLWRQTGEKLGTFVEALFIEVVPGGQVAVAKVDAKTALIAYEAWLRDPKQTFTENEKVAIAWRKTTEFPSDRIAVYWLPPGLLPAFGIFSRRVIDEYIVYINGLRNDGLTDQMLADEADSLARGYRAKKLEQQATQKNESDLLARSNAACAAEVQTTKDDADGGDESVGAVVAPAE